MNLTLLDRMQLAVFPSSFPQKQPATDFKAAHFSLKNSYGSLSWRLLKHKTPVNCARNSMPRASRVLFQAKKATLMKELNQGHIARLLMPPAFRADRNRTFYNGYTLEPQFINHSKEHQALGSDWSLQTPSLTSLPGSCFVTRFLISSTETRIALGFITCVSRVPHIGTQAQRAHSS